MDKKEVAAIFEKMMADIKSHDTHNCKQIGPCVYCMDCNIRLYQGQLKEK